MYYFTSYAFIAAPRIFQLIYTMMKPFMHQVTIDKVKIYGTDKKEWTAALLEDIDADQLPAYYGGTLRDPDDPEGKCPSKVGLYLTIYNIYLNFLFMY